MKNLTIQHIESEDLGLWSEELAGAGHGTETPSGSRSR